MPTLIATERAGGPGNDRFPSRDQVALQSACEARNSGIKPGQVIYGQLLSRLNGFPDCRDRHADRLRAGFNRRPEPGFEARRAAPGRQIGTNSSGGRLVTEMLGTKPGEIKALFKQTLDSDRVRELKKLMLARSGAVILRAENGSFPGPPARPLSCNERGHAPMIAIQLQCFCVEL